MLSPLFEFGTARVALVEFDSQAQLTRNFTNREALVDADLSNLQPGNDGAAILDAVSYSIQLLRNEPEDRQRVLLLISETRDHGSKGKIEDAVVAVGQANTMMYALAFSPGISNILDTGRGTNKVEMHNGVNFLDLAQQTAQAMRKNVPATVTSMTGGEYELFTTRKKFEVRMNDFTNHLHTAPTARPFERSIKRYGAGANQLLGRGNGKKLSRLSCNRIGRARLQSCRNSTLISWALALEVFVLATSEMPNPPPRPARNSWPSPGLRAPWPPARKA
jgi:hypothetical protein